MIDKQSHDDSILNPFPIKKLDALIRPFMVSPGRPFMVSPGQKISLAKEYDPAYKAHYLK